MSLVDKQHADHTVINDRHAKKCREEHLDREMSLEEETHSFDLVSEEVNYNVEHQTSEAVRSYTKYVTTWYARWMVTSKKALLVQSLIRASALVQTPPASCA